MFQRLSSLAGALFLALCASCNAAAAAEVRAIADYAVSLGNTNIANVTIGLEDDGRRYRLDANARITG
ncbi:MAG TPA: DUF3108 domain-containing protein, partial [Devosia sp.]